MALVRQTPEACVRERVVVERLGGPPIANAPIQLTRIRMQIGMRAKRTFGDEGYQAELVNEGRTAKTLGRATSSVDLYSGR